MAKLMPSAANAVGAESDTSVVVGVVAIVVVLLAAAATITLVVYKNKNKLPATAVNEVSLMCYANPSYAQGSNGGALESSYSAV